MPELLVRGEIALSLAGSKTNTADNKARAYKRVCYCLYIPGVMKTGSANLKVHMT